MKEAKIFPINKKLKHFIKSTQLIAAFLILASFNLTYAQSEECTLDQLSPLIQKDAKSLQSYQAKENQSDHKNKPGKFYQEEIVLRSKEHILIEQGGCVHYHIHYTFFIKAPSPKFSSEDWLKIAQKKLKKVEEVSKEPFQALRLALKEQQKEGNYQLGTPIPLGDATVNVSLESKNSSETELKVSYDFPL